MKKRLLEEEEEHGSKERWLLTYSDMITLLLALFIIMYSMSTIDAAKFKALAENMGAALNNPPKTTTKNDVEPKDSTKENNKSSLDEPMEKLKEEIQNYVKQNNLESQVEVTGTNSYVKINLKDSLLFLPNSDDMLSSNSPILMELNKLIKQYYSNVKHISIRGHTAYVPGNDTLKTEQFSWELSSNRALTVLNYLVKNGVEPKKFSIEGCSYYEPAATNDTESGRSKNRRVEIYITT